MITIHAVFYLLSPRVQSFCLLRSAQSTLQNIQGVFISDLPGFKFTYKKWPPGKSGGHFLWCFLSTRKHLCALVHALTNKRIHALFTPSTKAARVAGLLVDSRLRAAATTASGGSGAGCRLGRPWGVTLLIPAASLQSEGSLGDEFLHWTAAEAAFGQRRIGKFLSGLEDLRTLFTLIFVHRHGKNLRDQVID
jgi:hypothetical protein